VLKMKIASCYLSVAFACMFWILITSGEGYEYGSTGCTDPTFPTDIPATETSVLIQYCPISAIPAGSVDHLINVTSFTIREIPELTTFPNLIALAATLQEVVLEKNNIMYINSTWMNALHNLRSLTIIRNPSLDHIPDIKGMPYLLALDFDSNNLSSIPNIINCTNLATLGLNNNFHITRVTTFQSSLLSSVSSLQIDDAAELVFLPSTCPKSVSTFDVIVHDTSLDLCDCRNAWLKNAKERGAYIGATSVKCDGSYWSDLSIDQLLAVCTTPSDLQCKLWRLLHLI